MKSCMHRQLNPRLIAQACVVLVIAFALKLFYSMSGVNDLRWILAPTTLFVEFATGETFWFESYVGYMNDERSFLIADSCSGVNFLIMAFLMLSLMKLQQGLNRNVSWWFIPAAIAAAYFSTIVANTVRITIAMRLHRMSREMVWINPEQMHRLEGIFIYFGLLVLLFVLAESIDDLVSGRIRGTRRLLRQSMLPLSIYWLITLGIPIVTGAYKSGSGFWEHLLFVLITPAILILPLAATKWCVRQSRANFRTRDRVALSRNLQ